MNSKKLLIVDDKIPSLILLRAYLVRLGYERIDEAYDSFDALSKLMLATQIQAPYQAMFIDWTIPEMTDLEIIKTIRKLPGWNRLPIIVMSEELDETKIATLYSAGATQHLLRPVTEESLTVVLNSI